jgi:hypothetical protein
MSFTTFRATGLQPFPRPLRSCPRLCLGMFFQPLQGAGDVAAILFVTICDPGKDKVP